LRRSCGPMILPACCRVTICQAGAIGAGEGEDVEELAISSSNTTRDGPLLGEDSTGKDEAVGEGAGLLVIAQYSASALEWETACCRLEDQEMTLSPRKT
jgi:hypothetical protein